MAGNGATNIVGKMADSTNCGDSPATTAYHQRASGVRAKSRKRLPRIAVNVHA